MISHRFKTVFVHIPKTGGESIIHVFLGAHGLKWDDRQGLLLGYNPDRSRGPERLTHLLAREYVQFSYLDPSTFNSYLKFAVVRNPFNRAISEYRYRYPGFETTFEDFMEAFGADLYDDRARHMLPQCDFVTDECGNIIVDLILRYEEIAQTAPPLFQKIFGEPVLMPHENVSRAPPVRSISSRAAQLIRDRYARDFDLFSYSGFP